MPGTQGDGSPVTPRLDAVVIGAGFAGLYMLHVLRQRGFSARVLEMGDGVGGTWYWNRYPGARCDVQSVEYSYSFSEEIQQEWEWTELMASQPEIEAYANFVADKLDLRRDIHFGAKVTGLTYQERSAHWEVRTEDGEEYRCRFVVAATGCLSMPLEPDIKGLHTFEGISLYTNRFPKEGFDFSGLRAAVVGTGSSAVQSIPRVAEQASSLHVFQRSAAYTRPANNRPLEPGEMEQVKAEYAELRRRQKESFAGVLRFGAVAFDGTPPTRKILETPMEERLKVLDELEWGAPMAWADVLSGLEANQAAAELYAELVRRSVKDPATAESLVPHYPMGCKRQILDIGYFDAFNQPHVHLVDLRLEPIQEIMPLGIRTDKADYEFDVILFGTGFDAMTGALSTIDIRGREGQTLREVWKEEGPACYLGLQIAGFPNLFTITGPGSPSVLSNMIVSIEQHVEWIADCLSYMREHGYDNIEATAEAQRSWVEHVASLTQGSIRTAESCSSWYLGANVPGKPRVFMPYLGGLPAYREKCVAVVEAGYEGFVLA